MGSIVVVCFVLFFFLLPSAGGEQDNIDWAERADQVRQAANSAFSAYLKFGQNADDLAPLSKRGVVTDIHAKATFFDSLSTLWVTGLHDDFNAAVEELTMNSGTSTGILSAGKTFEYHIRVVGGLVGAYALSGRGELLSAAVEAAEGVLGAFSLSETPVPVPHVRIIPKWRQPLRYLLGRAIDLIRFYIDPSGMRCNSLAGIGSFALEFRWLSRETGDDRFRKAAEDIETYLERQWDLQQSSSSASFDHLFPSINLDASQQEAVLSSSHRQPFHRQKNRHHQATAWPSPSRSQSLFSDQSLREGVVPVFWLPSRWSTYRNKPCGSGVARLAGGGDSYYEYILKSFLLFPEDPDVDRRFHKMYESLARESYREFRQKESSHFVCFAPGMLALGAHLVPSLRSHLGPAEEMLQVCVDRYSSTPTGLSPDGSADRSFPLRPETVESLFVLWKVTGNTKYRDSAWRIWQSVHRYCFIKDSGGYSNLLDVLDPFGGHMDVQPSYFISEFLKYLYLTFADNSTISLDTYVFTTEGHPLPVQRPRCTEQQRFDRTDGCTRQPFFWSLYDGWLVEWFLLLCFVALAIRAVQLKIIQCRLRRTAPKCEKFF